mgnify:CR=1 FL=1
MERRLSETSGIVVEPPFAPGWGAPPDYEEMFRFSIMELKREGRYRIFQEHRRQVGAFPLSVAVTQKGENTVNVWCSNDYLGMGQHPDVRAAMREQGVVGWWVPRRTFIWEPIPTPTPGGDERPKPTPTRDI